MLKKVVTYASTSFTLTLHLMRDEQENGEGRGNVFFLVAHPPRGAP